MRDTACTPLDRPFVYEQTKGSSVLLWSANASFRVEVRRFGDRWVPWHVAGSVQGAIDASAELARSSSHGVHGQQNLAQAYLNQTTGGVDGSAGGMGGLGG